MAANNTLLHFLTQRADPVSTREFQRVFADAKEGTPEKEKKEEKPPSPELMSLFRTLFKSKGGSVEKFYGDDKDALRSLMPRSDGEKLDEFLKKTKDSKGKNLWDSFKSKFKGKDPLDMTPRDLENLFQVHRDQSSKPVSLNILLDPSVLVSPITPEAIASVVAKFYNDNRDFFTSPKNLSYDPSTKMLHYEGSDFKLKGLMDALDVKPEARKSILEQKVENSGIWYLPFTSRDENLVNEEDKKSDERPYFRDWEDDARYLSKGKPSFPRFKDAVDKSYQYNVKEGWLNKDNHYSWTVDHGQQILKFEGSLTDIRELFGTKIKEGETAIYDSLTHLLQTLKNKTSDYKRIGE